MRSTPLNSVFRPTFGHIRANFLLNPDWTLFYASMPPGQHRRTPGMQCTQGETARPDTRPHLLLHMDYRLLIAQLDDLALSLEGGPQRRSAATTRLLDRY